MSCTMASALPGSSTVPDVSCDSCIFDVLPHTLRAVLDRRFPASVADSVVLHTSSFVLNTFVIVLRLVIHRFLLLPIQPYPARVPDSFHHAFRYSSGFLPVLSVPQNAVVLSPYGVHDRHPVGAHATCTLLPVPETTHSYTSFHHPRC